MRPNSRKSSSVEYFFRKKGQFLSLALIFEETWAILFRGHVPAPFFRSSDGEELVRLLARSGPCMGSNMFHKHERGFHETFFRAA